MMVSVNAKQAKVLDVTRFTRLHALTLALLGRPAAFDGGVKGAITSPDIILLQEMSFSNVEILQKLLNQRSDFEYLIVATANSKTKMLMNSNTVTLVGEPEEWVDPCIPGTASDPGRRYLLARFTETTSGAPFTVANIHFMPNYSFTEQTRCKERNVAELRTQLAGETAPLIVGGDFNQRPTAQYRECDLNEETEPAAWWSMMTAPTDGGVAFIDAVRDASRNAGVAMENEWTHAQDTRTPICNGTTDYRKSRIDYFFVTGAAVADAHADHPGWTTYDPDIHDLSYFRYSDHRWVYARFSLVGPPKVTNTSARSIARGDIVISWDAVDGAQEYAVYRARGNNEYSRLTTTDALTTTFTDRATEHGETYRYAIAAVGADGTQGIESRGVEAVADSRGPNVSSVSPFNGARFVERGITITVRFDEWVPSSSVGSGMIQLRFKGRSVGGRLEQVSGRVFTFNPFGRLKNNKTYGVFVRPVDDRLGNSGNSFSSHFST
jgi:endonuclease/exonuclease/phosphatase family metal-dependent hydrolase